MASAVPDLLTVFCTHYDANQTEHGEQRQDAPVRETDEQPAGGLQVRPLLHQRGDFLFETCVICTATKVLVLVFVHRTRTE